MKWELKSSHFLCPTKFFMEICKYKDTIRIEIFEKEIRVISCGLYNYEYYKNIYNTYKIKDLSYDLKKEIAESNILCVRLKKLITKLSCKRLNFNFKKLEIYIKTPNKNSVKNVLKRVARNNLDSLVFWETPKSIESLILNYFLSLKGNQVKNLVFRNKYIFSIPKIKKVINHSYTENINFEIIQEFENTKLLKNRFLKKRLFSFIDFLISNRAIKDINIPIVIKDISEIYENIPYKYLKYMNFYSLKLFLFNFDKFKKGKLFNDWNFALFDEYKRGENPYFIRYGKKEDNTINLNLFEILDKNKNLIGQVERKNLSLIKNYFSKKSTFNLFLDLKTTEELQRQDYESILKILKDFPIFELTLGKSNILKFEHFKFLTYLSTKYFLIVEDLHPNADIIHCLKSTIDFKEYGVIENISDWKNVQPLVEQKYIDRIIYIEYGNDFENTKKELQNYYEYIKALPEILYDRFYIYPDYLIENNQEIVDFCKEHNNNRRPYYDPN